MGVLDNNEVLGLMGGGNMAQAILFPLFKKDLISPRNVIVCTRTDATLEIWRKWGCRGTLRTEEMFETANVVLWAIKPQVFPGVIDILSKKGPQTGTGNGILHISVMAGLSLDQFSSKIKHVLTKAPQRMIRVMPNIAMQVSCGVAVFACGPEATSDDKVLIQKMFTPIGLCFDVQENQINAYCGLFGSGIGFMFPILESLSDGAVKMGIPRNISLQIAAQVLKGAGELYLKTGTHPGALKDMVCSPGGTTIAGVAALEAGGARAAVINAVTAATKRGDELGALAASAPAAPHKK